MVKKNAAQMVAQKDELWKLRAKVTSLEQTLEQNAKEVEEGERKEKEKALVRASAEQIEMEKLQKVLAMRERELGHIKRLATSVVKQRTELEKFFHEALAQVKQEIVDSRQRYKKEALQAYRWKVREATAGKLKFPPIRTFHKSPHSTNSVHADMEAAAAWWVPRSSPHFHESSFCKSLCDIFISWCLLVVSSVCGHQTQTLFTPVNEFSL